MSNITTSGQTSYPAAIDTSTQLVDGANVTEIVSANYNGAGAAVVAIETELGTLPKGSFSDVKARLNDVDTSIVNLTAASNTITNKRSGDMVQYLSAVLTGVTSTNAMWVNGQIGGTPSPVTLSITNAPPFVSTRGTSFGDTLLVNIKPTSTLNSVYAQLTWMTAASVTVVAGLFLAGSSSAIVTSAAASSSAVGAGSLFWKATTVSNATTSYGVRFGLSSPTLAAAATATWNGITNQGLFANSLVSILAVWEIQN